MRTENTAQTLPINQEETGHLDVPTAQRKSSSLFFKVFLQKQTNDNTIIQRLGKRLETLFSKAGKKCKTYNALKNV